MWVVIPYVAIQMTTFDVAQRKFRAWASDGKTKNLKPPRHFRLRYFHSHHCLQYVYVRHLEQ